MSGATPTLLMMSRLRSGEGSDRHQLAGRKQLLVSSAIEQAGCSINRRPVPSQVASSELRAAYAGAAPLDASSAGTVRHRLNRGGNRRLNAVLCQIAITQAHHSLQARTYLDRRVREGKTRREARRALKRYIIRAIWRLWQECQPAWLASTSAAA